MFRRGKWKGKGEVLEEVIGFFEQERGRGKGGSRVPPQQKKQKMEGGGR